MDISKADDPELKPTHERHESAALEKNDELQIDPAIEKRVRRKIDRVLIPLVMGLCKLLHTAQCLVSSLLIFDDR